MNKAVNDIKFRRHAVGMHQGGIVLQSEITVMGTWKCAQYAAVLYA